MVYTGDLKSPAERYEGSNPSTRTNNGSMMELVDIGDLKSLEQWRSCEFESHYSYHFSLDLVSKYNLYNKNLL